MIKKLLLISIGFLLCTYQSVCSQNGTTQNSARSTIGVSGSSEKINVNNQTYVVQQSIGQASVIGTFSSNGSTVIQGFLHPYVWSSIIDKELPLNLTASIYPNPFSERLQAVFDDTVETPINVEVYDVLGKQVYTQQFEASQKIDFKLYGLSDTVYILKLTANNKQFVQRILKK